jgi:hypothetical protein
MVGRPSAGPTLLLAVAALSLGCGRGGLTVDAGHADASDAADVGADVAGPDELLACSDAVVGGDGSLAPGPMSCGGDVSLAGLTPLGAFVARNVTVDIGSGDCPHLVLILDDGEGASGFTGIWLTANLPYADPRAAPAGTMHADGSLYALLSPTREINRTVPVTIEIASADPPFDANGPRAVSVDAGVVGHIAGTIDVDTGCGHLKGTFAAPYCHAFACVGPPP